MPTYQYACTSCDHEFEQFQSFSDDALSDCPACSGRLRKVYGSVGVVFKGSGFYRTDSRNGDGKVPATGSDGAAAKDPAKGAGKGADKNAGKGTGKGAEAGSTTGGNTSSNGAAAGTSKSGSGGSAGSSGGTTTSSSSSAGSTSGGGASGS